MKKQLVIIGIFAILVCIGLSGCNQINNTLDPEKSKFVGTWQNSTSMVIDLFSDGKCTFLSINGTWDLKEGKLVLVLSTGRTITYNYLFSNNNRTLALIDLEYGTTFNVTKQ
jgi:hypothetical protein